jgi:hypothetical protein
MPWECRRYHRRYLSVSGTDELRIPPRCVVRLGSMAWLAVLLNVLRFPPIPSYIYLLSFSLMCWTAYVLLFNRRIRFPIGKYIRFLLPEGWLLT